MIHHRKSVRRQQPREAPAQRRRLAHAATQVQDGPGRRHEVEKRTNPGPFLE